ncbi:PAS domain S-box-containing protein [Rhodopseudomonas julia]|uniref:histidine kinase n=2 Tax=Rhodopseudomonas julia TaxID=200617 RepID=A0ABU0C7L1_9BRAD|nr:PAS domain S-box-containing protein [Rhodopseudomonas julia]
MIWVTDAEGRVIFANRYYETVLGAPAVTMLGDGWQRAVLPEDLPSFYAAFMTAFAARQSFRVEIRFIDKHGQARWYRCAGAPRYDSLERFLGFTGCNLDISEGKRAAEESRRNELRFRAIAESMPQIVWSALPDGRLDYFNQRWTEYTGQTGADAVENWPQIIHADDRDRTGRTWEASLNTGETYEIEYRLRRHDGVYRWSLARALPVYDEATGEILRWFGTCTDIEDQVAARQALARSQEELEKVVSERTAALQSANEQLRKEIIEREHAEEALRQAQKMEAIGQLTGGVAHDFNNLLTVISGNLERLLRRLDDDAPDLGRIRLAAEHAMRGSKRAAELTERLLSFARRQPLRPKPVDATQLVMGMADLLERTLGEQIELKTEVDDDVWPATVDANHLESAILNLAVNARDAMPGGGVLTISLSNQAVEAKGSADVDPDMLPGDYVRLCISDTGTGMSQETRAHAFDPFFTTKEIGAGTGLGLSQVYGFLKQSGGGITLNSEMGEGTEICLFLPRSSENLQNILGESLAATTALSAKAGEGTILVVEDDDDVRRHSTSLLAELGYRVLEAGDGERALALLRDNADVDLLFTDVGLPGGLNGRALAERALAERPDIRVLFTSAYAHEVFKSEDNLGKRAEILAKPFDSALLAGRLTALLSEEPPAGKPGDPAHEPVILLVEDEMLISMLATELLEELGLGVETATSAAQAMGVLSQDPARFDVVMIDIGLPDRNGDELADDVRALRPEVPIIFASGRSSSELEETYRHDRKIRVVSKPYDGRALAAKLSELGVCVRPAAPF